MEASVNAKDATCDELMENSGVDCPRLFGDAKTPLLMYLSVRPGSSGRDLTHFMGRSYSSVAEVVRSLKDRGLLVTHRRRYWLDASISRSRELEQFLQALALHFGISPDPKLKTLRKRRSNGKPRQPADVTLRSIFQTELRTTLLLLIVGLGEIYPRELTGLRRDMAADVCAALRSLEAQGILISRRCRQVRLYRMNPSYPARKELRTLLVVFALDREDIVQLINAMLILRRNRHFNAPMRLAPFFEIELTRSVPAKSLNGTRRRVEGFIGMGKRPPLRHRCLGGAHLSEKNRRLVRIWKRNRVLKTKLTQSSEVL